MMDEEPSMPRTSTPKHHNNNTRARTRERNLALQQHHAQLHTPFPPAKTQTIVHNFYLP